MALLAVAKQEVRDLDASGESNLEALVGMRGRIPAVAPNEFAEDVLTGFIDKKIGAL